MIDSYSGNIENMKNTRRSTKLPTENIGFITAKSSTPRRKKIATINLSPKYISLEALDSTDPLAFDGEDKIRQLPRKNSYESDQSQNGIRAKTRAVLSSSPDANIYIRRTDCLHLKNSSLSGSDPDTPHKRSFESPIEKLLRKNKALYFQTWPNLEISPNDKRINEQKEFMDIKIKMTRVRSLELLQKNGLSTFQLNQHDDITMIASENYKNPNKGELNKVSELNKMAMKKLGKNTKSVDIFDNPVIIKDNANNLNSSQEFEKSKREHPDAIEILEENDKNESFEAASDMEIADTEKTKASDHSHDMENIINLIDPKQEKGSGKFFNSQAEVEYCTNDRFDEIDEPKDDHKKSLAASVLLKGKANKETEETQMPVIVIDDDDEKEGAYNYNYDNENQTLPGISTANSKSRNYSKIETFLHDENIISISSPSSISADSAKGSSVTNEVAWLSFSPGDIFWGQIYSYCYWPCIVCPDPEGKTITTEVGIGRSTTPQIMVHVRFFADNARRNWVKRDHLLVYNDLESFHQKMFDVEEKYGKKSPKYKAFIVPKAKMKLWNQAIEEANIVKSTSIEKRIQKFYEIYENSRLVSKLERKRRQSVDLKFDPTSDIGSLYSSSENLSIKQHSTNVKRDRSNSPFSPAYSPIGPKSAKRRKLVEDVDNQSACYNPFNVITSEEDFKLVESSFSRTTPSQHDEEIYENGEFQMFFKTMKEFVMAENNDEKLESSLIVAVRNIWALRHISNCHMEARALEAININSLGSTVLGTSSRSNGLKRLSNRLRIISLKRNLANRTNLLLDSSAPISTSYSLTPDIPTEEKVKRNRINRPIEEVIDDIFNLDSKYLFKGLSRDPICKYCLESSESLKKCSKNCQTWFHINCIGRLEKIKNKKSGRKPKLAVNSVNDELISDANSTSRITSDKNETSDHQSKLLNQIAEDQSPSQDQSRYETNLIEEGTIEKETVAICQECKMELQPKCAVCKENGGDMEELIQCNIPHCLNVFHPTCCRYWPQSKITKSKNKIESFRCPTHVCHTCVSDDPKGKFQNISSSKLTRCIKCPATFHTDSTCIPAGSQILNAAYVICPRHNISKADQKVNVNWCFICVKGGQVVCCETCPTAIHASCLNIPIDPEESYICEECETGRMPLYGEMVWAKFNNFRWWPAIILPPTEIPQNIWRMHHNPSDFVIRFFGTHDHGWISRRRVYLYLEGDSTEPPRNKKSLDANYTRGVEEAKRIWEIIKSKKALQSLSYENKQKLHPQPYVKIKSNRAVPPLKLHLDLDKVSKCECDKDSENPCGPDSNCLNRVLYHECNPKLCPAGERCQNQMFESRISPKLEVVYMKERGFGLVCREPISAGTFVIEYVGEVINHDEFKQRMMQKTIDREENFYFLSLEKDYIIDAGPKGNLARFMNHSCDPNCETQKWSVNGLNRVGLFAIRDIPTDTELTFNYHWDELLGAKRKTCFCGSIRCAGQIGGKFKETKIKDDSKAVKLRGPKKSNVKSLKRLQKRGHAKGDAKQLLNTKPKLTIRETKMIEDDRISIDLAGIEEE